MLVVIAFLSQHPGAIYADAFGYGDEMAALVAQKRDLARAELLQEAGSRMRLILDRIRHAALESAGRTEMAFATQPAMIRQLAGLARTLTDLLIPTGEAATKEAVRFERADHLLGKKRTPEDGDVQAG